jgi:hypothetical protein
VIFQEWIRYYLKLGIKIMIFDRDGANYEFIESLTNVDSNAMEKNLIYYAYTIRGILDPSMRGVKFDNNEHSGQFDKDGQPIWIRMKWKARSIRFEMQGHDKVLTLTHCRFELKSVFGIEDSIVADYDEYLYCPAASMNALAQGTEIRSVLSNMKQQHVEQAAFPQRVVHNTTESTRDCIIEQARSNSSSASVFHCFAPYKYVVQAHSIKSAHLGHACPLTGYHQACPTGTAPRSYDCPCKHNQVNSCQFVHLSTNNLHFKDSQRNRYHYSDRDYKDMLTKKNEIYQILRDPNDFK